MKYNNFLKHLEIHRTTSGKGRGVRCNLALYMYKDGHANFYSLHDDGTWAKHQNKEITIPANDTLDTIDTFIDILYKMRKRARKIK